MSAGDRDGVDGFLTQLVGDLPDLLHLEPAQIVRGADGVEKRRFTEYRSRRYSNFACRDEAPDVRWVAQYQRSENPDAGCHLSRPKPDLEA